MKIFVVLFVILITLPIISNSITQEGNFLEDENNNKSNSKQKLQLDTPPLYLNLIWHQHQPIYKNPLNNNYELPWVYMHSIKDYRFMVEIIPDDINVTFDLTGSLLQQLLDYANYTNNGITDRRMELALMSEINMSFQDKVEIWEYFFDINSQFIQGRYQELNEKRSNASSLEEGISGFSNQDWLDLKGLFFFWWTNLDYIDNDSVLLELKTNYMFSTRNPLYTPWTHENISYVINFGLNITKDVIPFHKAALDFGNIELITSPLNHPILPLLINSTSAHDTYSDKKDLPLPETETNWSTDALEQINRSSILFSEIFDSQLNGLWPSEMAVSPAMIPLANATGIKWLATDQKLLSKIIPELKNFDPINPSVNEEHLLYQPYIIHDEDSGKEIVTVYRNVDFSDDIDSRLGGMEPIAAAKSFVNRFKSIYDRFNDSTNPDINSKPHLVTLALDGENAWENYQYNGEFTANLFLKELYASLQSAQNEGWLKTITTNQYLNEFGYRDLDRITVKPNEWVGSWKEGSLDIWIGENEENSDWDRLSEARNALIQAEIDNPGVNYSEAWDVLYQAEGSDWFWWAGSDWNSANDQGFDWIFKLLLRGVYEKIGLSDQEILSNYPYLFAKLKAPVSASVTNFLNPTIDGVDPNEEWKNAAYLNDTEGTSEDIIKSIFTGYNEEGKNFFLRIDPSTINITNKTVFAVYFSSLTFKDVNVFSRQQPITINTTPLGIEIGYELLINISNSIIESSQLSRALGNHSWKFINNISNIAYNNVIEISLPFIDLGLISGDALSFVVTAANGTPLITKDITPNNNPWSFIVPFGEIAGEVIFEILDDLGDDSLHNPNNDGSKSALLYPSNSVFNPGYGHFDLTRYSVADDLVNNMAIFQVEFADLIVNLGWNTPTFTLPYTQIYVDTDNIIGSGRTDTIENARVSIEENHAWDFMINLEGEVSFQYILFSNGSKINTGVTINGDNIRKTVTARIPQEIIGTPHNDWNYAVIVGSKDFHAFRNINAEAQEWIGGGGSDSFYDPNVYDMTVPEGKNQKTLLDDYSEVFENYSEILMVGPNIFYEKDIEPPTITIISPKNNEVLEGKSNKIIIDLSFSSSDNTGIILFEVFMNQFFVISDIRGTINTISFEWYMNGEYNLRINAFDIEGNFGSAAVRIMVQDLIEDPKKFFNPFDINLESSGSPTPAYLLFTTIFALIIVYSTKKKQGENK